MTREEAIYRLKNTAWLGSDADRVATEEAVQMAIEALGENESLAKSVNDAAELIRKLQKKNEGIPPERLLDDVSTAFENGYKQGKFEAQQSQQKTGKWIQAEDIPTEYAVCTNCKGHGEFYMDYCWHCGARMEKEA